MRKNLLMVIVIILTLTMMAACSSNGGNNTENTPNDTTENNNSNNPDNTSNNDDTNVEVDPGPPAELSMMVQAKGAWPIKENWLVIEELEKHLNVELDISGYQGNWWDAIPLIIASGDLPDLMWMSGTGILHKSGQDGALVNLNDHMDKMPNMKAWLEDHPEEAEMLLTHDGKLFMTPSRGAYGTYNGLWLHREDIFEKHNLEEPTTFDEFFDTLMTLKEIYPDSYPLYVSGASELASLAYSFGTSIGTYYNRDAEEWRYGPSEDNFREAVEFLNKAYENKLIPQEYGNMDKDKKNELVTTNRTFVMFGYINNIQSYNDIGREANPDFSIGEFTPPGGAGHKGVHGREFAFHEGIALTTTSENKEAALKYIDAQYTEEVRDIVSWGKEGVTYEVVDGKKTYLPAVQSENNRSVNFGLRTAGLQVWFDTEANVDLYPEDTKRAYEEAKDHYLPANPQPPLTPEENDAITLKEQAIDKYIKENTSKFVIGRKPLSEWDAYVQGLVELGMEDVIQVYEQAYDRIK